MRGQPKAAAPVRLSATGRRVRRSAVIGSVLRVAGLNLVLALIYVYAPLGQRLHGRVALELTLALVVAIGVAGWEVHKITRSSLPEARALEAIAMTLPLVLLPFAATYYVMARTAAGSFSTELSRLDALYFVMTTFSTVGYGDIVPKTEAARAVVMGQMVVDLILVGLIAKVIFGVARTRRESLRNTPGDQ